VLVTAKQLYCGDVVATEHGDVYVTTVWHNAMQTQLRGWIIAKRWWQARPRIEVTFRPHEEIEVRRRR